MHVATRFSHLINQFANKHPGTRNNHVSRSAHVMVLTKAYLRYVPAGTFGVVASSKSNCVFIRGASAKKAQYVGVAALENVNIWNVKTGEKVM